MTRELFTEGKQIFLDLIKTLEQQRKTLKSGQVLQVEDIYDVFCRLLGISEQKTDSPTIIHNFLKFHTPQNDFEIQKINSILVSLRNRLNRYDKVNTKIKLQRIKKITSKPDKPIDSEQLATDDPTKTKLQVSKALKDIVSEYELKGVIDQEVSANQALALSIEGVTSQIPSEIEQLRSQIVSLIRMYGKDAYNNINNLNRINNQFKKQVEVLENTDKILFEGFPIYGREKEVISLLNMLNVLIFLTDNRQAKFQCSQCKYFSNNNNPACLFVGESQISLTKTIKTTDENGNSIFGQLTKERFSCKEVWSLTTNDYFTFSDKLIEQIKELLRG